MAELVKARQDESGGGDGNSGKGNANTGHQDYGAPFASERLKPHCGIMAYLVQLLPIFFILPAWQIARYLLFFALLLEKSCFFWSATDRDVITFLGTYMVFHAAWVTIVRLMFVIIKWLVIGRYRPVATPFGAHTICGGGSWMFVVSCSFVVYGDQTMLC